MFGSFMFLEHFGTYFFVFYAVALFGFMIFAQELGRWIGKKCLEMDPNAGLEGTVAIEGAAFAIWGLLLAFTFSGAASRFDERRVLVGQESNAISTAYLRLDMIDGPERMELKELFRTYLKARIDLYNSAHDGSFSQQIMDESTRIQRLIWKVAVEAAKKNKYPSTPQVLLPPINDMFDIATTRLVATQKHPPVVVYLLLFAISSACAFFVGFDSARTNRRPWVHSLCFVLLTSLIVYVILDMEYPRVGLITVEHIDEVLAKNLQTMN